VPRPVNLAPDATRPSHPRRPQIPSLAPTTSLPATSHPATAWMPRSCRSRTMPSGSRRPSAGHQARALASLLVPVRSQHTPVAPDTRSSCSGPSVHST
jgi:hypothetical protein